HARNDGDDKREKQDRPADRDFIQARQTVRNELEQKFFSREKNRQPGDSAQQRKKQTLCQQLTRQAAASGAEGVADRHFSSASGGTSERKICAVQARDEKDESDSCERQNQR